MDPKQIELGGLHIYTTLDVSMQKAAEKEIEERIDPDSSIQTALVSMDPRNGDVKALVGGRNYAESPFDRAIQAKRAPGSTFKPFLYYTALKNGYTPSTAIKSEPTSLPWETGSRIINRKTTITCMPTTLLPCLRHSLYRTTSMR